MLALRRSTVVTTTAAGRLNVYRDGVLRHSWPVESAVGADPGSNREKTGRSMSYTFQLIGTDCEILDSFETAEQRWHAEDGAR